jgi:hypothetical protein
MFLVSLDNLNCYGLRGFDSSYSAETPRTSIAFSSSPLDPGNCRLLCEPLGTKEENAVPQAVSFFENDTTEKLKKIYCSASATGACALAALVGLVLAGVVWSGLLNPRSSKATTCLFIDAVIRRCPRIRNCDFDEAWSRPSLYPIPRNSVDDVLEKEAGSLVTGFDVADGTALR